MNKVAQNALNDSHSIITILKNADHTMDQMLEGRLPKPARRRALNIKHDIETAMTKLSHPPLNPQV